MKSKIGEEKAVEILVFVVPAPLALFEVEKEFFLSNPAQFGETNFSETPETLNAVDVVFTASKFVVFVVDTVVFVAVGEEAVVGAPTVGEDIAFGEHLPS